jgi:putative PEP-CTERM system histidine kinase
LTVDALVATNLLCAALYLGLGVLLAAHSERRTPVFVLIGASAATGLWALSVALDSGTRLDLGLTVPLLRACHPAAWVLFLVVAYRAGLPAGESPRLSSWMLTAAATAWVFLLGTEALSGGISPGGSKGGSLIVALSARLLLAMAGLVLLESLLRESSHEARARIKYLCVGVGGLLGYELFLASEALLLRRLDPGLEGSRAAVAVIAAPLIALAAARNPSWSTRLNLARRAVLHSAVLVGAGIYLLALAAAGTLVRVVGGDWARMFQATLFFSGLMLLVVLFSSAGTRALIRRRFSSYLFTHRHDYRETWQRFTKALAGDSAGQSLQERAFRAVAGVVDSPGGGLWFRESDLFVLLAGSWVPEDAREEPTEDRLIAELESRGERILDLGEPADPASARNAGWLPEWLRRWTSAWVLIPLVHRKQVIGFIVLTRPPLRSGLDPEDEELLQTVACHVASHLAEEHNTRALEETRRFEEVSRSMAFIAHDLRNLANELALTLSNARKHVAKPEFQRDLLLTMEESVASMQRLLERLKAGKAAPGSSAPTDLTQLIGDSLRARCLGDEPVELELERGMPLRVAGDPDRLVAMCGHLIQNAVEAAGPDGHVTVRLRRDGDSSVFEVVDDGPGMTPEAARDRLFHPFRSSKPQGLGIGLYECHRLARELGGQLAIESTPGRGTTARLRLPLAPQGASATDFEACDAGA